MESTTVHDDSNLLLGDVTFHTASITVADTALYSLTPEDAVFFKTQIGIDDDEELKRHILEIQAKAYKVAPYPCIRGFTFLK
ncbi:hypothetical protein AZE42_03402 [Rhizopogon vesiculosus]|uniref:Uncharacterized protein n=1 Tax=Rhizopogon vesiculosus TaxID=180088 RepID=A0A1J8PT65_9AGAM|nr:hypothetical protein AZE42_03402 [Rhizopogon vesiculosus]